MIDIHHIKVDDVLLKLFEYYNVFSMHELAAKLDISQPAISKWKKNNSIMAIKKRCRELGIYNEIFGSFSENVLTFSMSNTQKKLNIIETMIKDDKELEDKFNEYLKAFIEDNL